MESQIDDLKDDAKRLLYDFTKLKHTIDSCKHGAENLRQQLEPLNSKISGLNLNLTNIARTTLRYFSNQLAENITGIKPYNYTREFGKMMANMFTGARASGGNVASGLPYLVGERGPELFVPGHSGNVIANNQWQGNGGNLQSVNIVMNISTPDADSFCRSQGQILAEAAQALRRASRNL